MSQGKLSGSSTGTSGSNSNSFENELMSFLFGTPASTPSSMPTTSYGSPMATPLPGSSVSQPAMRPAVPMQTPQQTIGNQIGTGIVNSIVGTPQPQYTTPVSQPQYTTPVSQPQYTTPVQHTTASAPNSSSTMFAPGSLASRLFGSAGSSTMNNLFGGGPVVSGPQFTTLPSSEPMGPTNAELGYNPVDSTTGGITDTSGNNLDLNTLNLGGGGDFTGPGDFNISPVAPGSEYTGGEDYGGWYDTTPVESSGDWSI